MTNQPPPFPPPPMRPYAPLGAAAQPTGALSWTAFGLALGAALFAGIALIPSVPAVPFTLPLGIAAVVVGILALRKRSQPRWPAIVALALCGLWIAGFAVFAFSTLAQLGLFIWGQI